MSIRDDLDAIKPTKPLNFYAWLDTLDLDDRTALRTAAEDGYSSSALVKVVRANGGVAAKETIDAWRASLGRDR